jgi:hypothetical protein
LKAVPYGWTAHLVGHTEAASASRQMRGERCILFWREALMHTSLNHANIARISFTVRSERKLKKINICPPHPAGARPARYDTITRSWAWRFAASSGRCFEIHMRTAKHK